MFTCMLKTSEEINNRIKKAQTLTINGMDKKSNKNDIEKVIGEIMKGNKKTQFKQ